ncbi:MAG: AraC family transcriptional regulator [Gemmatimonadaceae bacterium]
MKPETRNFYERAVRSAVERIVSSLGEALDLEELARHAALSPFHFHRVFRGMIGETPLELHRRLALERAAWSLTTSDDRITTIAFAAGYETHESFTRAFRERYGCSPNEYRRIETRDQGCARPPQFELATRSGIHFSPDGIFTPITFVTGVHTMQATIVDRPGASRCGGWAPRCLQ